MGFLISQDLEQFLESLEKFFAERFPAAVLNDKPLDMRELERDWCSLAELGAMAAPLPEDYGGLGMGVLAAYAITERSARWLSPLPVRESIGVVSSLICLVTSQKLPGSELLASAANELAVGGVVGVCSYLRKIKAGEISALDEAEITQPSELFTLKNVDISNFLTSEAAEQLIANVSRLAIAAEFSGIASRVVEMTSDYVKTRKQFGKTIGSFQAVQHKLADMLMWSEQISSLGRFASWAADNDQSQFETSSIAAFGYGAEYCPKLIEAAIQLHGGIGFTYEYPLHLYLRRALALSSRFGGAESAYSELVN